MAVKSVGVDRARTTRPAAASTTASASTAWARPRTAWRCRACCPTVGTFFVFSDYMRPAVRLAALMQTKVAFVWTHDSVGVGEDGPTHQPVEQLASLRAMPGPARDPPGRRQRGRGRVARAHRRRRARPRCCSPARRSPVLDGTAERAAAGRRARRVRARRRRRRARRPRAHRHRLRGRGVRSPRRETLAERGLVGARRVDAVVGPVRGADRRVPRGGAPARPPDARGRGRRRASAGSATPTTS